MVKLRVRQFFPLLFLVAIYWILFIIFRFDLSVVPGDVEYYVNNTFTIASDKSDEQNQEIHLTSETKTKQTNQTDKYEHAMRQRTNKPTKCQNSSHDTLNINPTNNNWAPYYYRCKFDRKLHPNGNIGEGFYTKELVYKHVFKAGGTTIQQGLQKLIDEHKFINLTAYNSSRGNHIYGGGFRGIKIGNYLNFVDKKLTFAFSMVRDPVSKFLSGFYEANKRMIEGEAQRSIKVINIHTSTSNSSSSSNGIEIMRKWMKIMLELENKHGKHGKFGRRLLPHAQYINNHLNPNILFLPNVIEYDFIGNLQNFHNDLPQLLASFVVDKDLEYIYDGELYNNHSLLMNTYFKHRRDRHQHYMINKTQKFSIEKAMLTDGDIDNICKIYWLDYICFPFDIPKQCNISYLFHQHYDKDVSYLPCY